MVDEATLANYMPMAVDVEAGESYFWCGCGQSDTQPLCNRNDCGDHAIRYDAELTDTVYFCACKRTKDAPFCDGSHAEALRELAKSLNESK